MSTSAIKYSGLSGAQLTTLKRTIAKDLTDIEFDLFMEACRSYNLDPFRKQIIPVIYHKNDKAKRSMTLITTRDGQRVIASRQGDYRPAQEPAQFRFHPTDWQHDPKTMPPNPHRIESVTVTLFKKYGSEWFPVVGEVFWDEYAPMGYGWTSSQWPKMPRVMITKCAETAALRAGWPDAFAGLYLAEELDSTASAAPDGSASEQLQKAEEERRMKLIGRGIMFDLDGTRIEKIAHGQVFDRIVEALEGMTDDEVLHFRNRNELGLREFWAVNGSDALALKKIIEPRCEAALTASAEPAEKEST
jgi:phage recombination protein Bet